MFSLRLWLIALLLWSVQPAAATDLTTMYPRAVLEAEAARLSSAVRKIYTLGIVPTLTAAERTGLGEIDFRFPLPEPGDDPMNFYAYRDERDRAVVVMPILSLKAVEDMALAYAWVQVKGFRHSTIDLYYAMLRHRPAERFPGGRPPDVLTALGLPANLASKLATEPAVDRLSLSLRNEAYAFILVHELGHALFRHQGYDSITKDQARSDEVQSDRFALDVLARSGTPPLGAVFYFQAQIYRFRHRGEFATPAAFDAYLATAATHPMSVDRIQAMAQHIAGPLAAARAPGERSLWIGIGTQLASVADILRDGDLQRCVAQVAAEAPFDVLKPSATDPTATMLRLCRAGTRP